MNETATTIDAAAPALPRLRHVAAELDRRLFVAGVAACTAGVAVFLLVQLSAWPPHEDETLPLFVGRQPIDGLFDIVLGKRGGAPLHFLLAWIVAHAGGGLETMRFFSALFAVASIPAIAVLGNRLAGRGPALAACVLAAASWILLFHGIYARMYSLFLFLSTLSYLALLRATERGGKRAWTLWAIVMLLTIGSHPYGALVLGSQGLYVLVTRSRLRQAVVAFGVVLLLAVPLWRSSVVLANRLEVGVGGGGGKLRTPREVFAYLWHVAGDASTGYAGVLVIVLVFAVYGLVWQARRRPRSALLTGCVVITPTAFFLVGRFGGNSAPESRHLIFVLPFFALAAASGIVAASRSAGRFGPLLAGLVVLAIVPAEIAWAWHKTPALFDRENPVRVDARRAAAEWLGATSRPDDVLFAYEPRLPRGLGEASGRGVADGRAPCRSQAGARDTRRDRQAARARRLGVRRRRQQQRREADDGRAAPAVPAQRVRSPRLRAVPDHPHAQADGHGRPLPRGRPQGRTDREVARDG